MQEFVAHDAINNNLKEQQCPEGQATLAAREQLSLCNTMHTFIG